MAKKPMDPNLADVEELVEGAQLVVHFEGFPRPERGIVKKIEKGPRKDLIMETFFEDGTTVVCTVDGNGTLWEAGDEDRNALPWFALEHPADDMFAGSKFNADGTKQTITQLVPKAKKAVSNGRGKRPVKKKALTPEEQKKRKLQRALQKIALDGAALEADRVRIVDEVLRGRA